jgi:predicted aspartyl protease
MTRSIRPLIAAINLVRAIVLVSLVLTICPAPVISASLPAADDAHCKVKPIGQLTVAILDNVPFVTLIANGLPVTLILDTGAERTVFNPSVAERIGARAPQVEFQRQLRGISRTLTTREIELQSFSAGGLSIPWHRVVVAPVTTANLFTVPFDGLLGNDVLSGFDIDLDLPHQRLLFYEKRACVTAPPWAGSYTGISAGRSGGDHLFFPVQVDHREVPAIIDTGAQRTTVSKSAALGLGVTEELLGQDRAITTHGAAAEQLGSRIHQFRQLQVGRQIISHPQLVVSDVKLEDAGIVLGIDLLRSMRIFMSFASLEIFLSK